jgi:hypothetical protein
MTKNEVKTHPAFLRLSDADQRFVSELLENGNDKRAAAHATWQCKSDASADALANKTCRKASVKYLMDAYLGVDVTKTIPSRDELAAFAWSKAQKAPSDGDAHKWASMVSQVMGYNTKPADPNEANKPEPAAEDDSTDEFI